MIIDTRSPSGELVEELRKSIHEFNNTLTPILANAQLVRVMIDGFDADVSDAMDDIVEAAERAGKLVRKMRETAKELETLVEHTAGSAEGRSYG